MIRMAQTVVYGCGRWGSCVSVRCCFVLGCNDSVVMCVFFFFQAEDGIRDRDG